jgi:peptidylprolyl isomerase
MRRTLLVLTLALAACGGGDDSSSSVPSMTATTSDPTTDTTVAPGPTAPVVSLECEDTPDPADYIEGQIPPANRPCEIPTALQVAPVRDGVGRNAQDGDTLIVDYIGIRSEDGLIFDESYTRGTPLDFVVGRGGVIQGWDDGLLGSQAGALVKLDVPAELAYGDNPPGGADGAVKPGDALTFIVEVRAVIPPVTAEDAPLDLEVEPSIGAVEVTVTELEPGDGAVAELGKTAVVHLLLVRGDNEVVLFNTWERSDPLEIVLEEGQTVLPGVIAGLEGARVGSLLAIAMPPADAFGAQGETSLGLPAGVDLIAIVEVVGVY